jgi:hypothetical protein
MTVAIIPAAAEGPAFAVGDALTVVQAAMVYAGRNPRSDFLRDASLDDLEIFLGRGSHEERKPSRRSRAQTALRRLSWDIYCEIKKAIADRKIEPLRARYLPSGEIDPRATTISIACLVEIARKRGNKPQYLAHLIEQPQRREKPEILAPLVDEPPPRTGTAGRPSMSRELLEEEMRARVERDELKDTLREEVLELLAWLEREHPTWPCPKLGTAKNNLRKAYNQLKAGTK